MKKIILQIIVENYTHPFVVCEDGEILTMTVFGLTNEKELTKHFKESYRDPAEILKVMKEVSDKYSDEAKEAAKPLGNRIASRMIEAINEGVIDFKP